MGGVNPVLAEVLERTIETVETFLAFTAFDATVVRVVAEFEIGVDCASGAAPMTRDMDAVFRRVVVRDKQRIVVEPVRWERAELIRTNTDGPLARPFPG